ncbi:S-adenosyl-L-methionine-dependent methyltransferase [Penicillium capsulatum]|uniref:S-adenosyl-L-methionine-dependent methyltransferase n=1 Tax=Penicillium capsulatum TaxID=69766 RepID=A0A9W9I189_9EURO|nr:S-adenosyl-L-methionine-dependent methyltransferase [Penicillium capsulatum]KAJ6116877.1 S-adenosyl-L-methionine-dependent methyltransferase [Penicillium capsulatum]
MSSTSIENALTPWEENAAIWDEAMGDEGNHYFRLLELPILEKLVPRQRGSRAIDLATGNGLVARWLVQEGMSVLATDGASAMVERARARTNDCYQRGQLSDEHQISFQTLDVTDPGSWQEFMSNISEPKHGFDIITMNMALMDIKHIEPLASSLKQLLNPNGCFVATLLHPLFFTSGADRQIIVHEDPVTGKRSIERSIILKKYLNAPPARQLPFPERDMVQPPFSFHRPLHVLLAPFFQAGLVMDALQETNFDESFHDSAREYASVNFVEFPKILGFRMRRAA